MARRETAFRAQSARVLVISFEQPDRVRALRDRLKLPFPTMLDPHRHAYDAFGLNRAPAFRTYLDPRVVWGYTKMIAAGELPDLQRGQDRRQLGGDFVIDGSGRIVLAHPERGPDDRVAVSTLLRALEPTERDRRDR